MSILFARSGGGSNRAVVIPSSLETFAIAIAAGAVGYAIHHLPPLRGHFAAGVAIALLGAGAVAVGLRAAGARRDAYALLTVLVPPPGGPEARPLRREDLDFCAALHANALDHGFFVSLGPGFLRAYYASFLDSPHAVALAATVAGQPVGSLVGILRNRAHVRWLVRNRGLTLALNAAAGMTLHPAAALRFIRTRLCRYASFWRRHRRRDGRAAQSSEGDVAVLSHIAVVPGARGIGVGKVLVREFEARARRSGAARGVLTTLEESAGAGDFYALLGWTRSDIRRTPDGGGIEEWARDLKASEG